MCEDLIGVCVGTVERGGADDASHARAHARPARPAHPRAALRATSQALQPGTHTTTTLCSLHTVQCLLYRDQWLKLLIHRRGEMII